MEDKDKTLYCGNLHEKVTEDLLYELFLQVIMWKVYHTQETLYFVHLQQIEHEMPYIFLSICFIDLLADSVPL